MAVNIERLVGKIATNVNSGINAPDTIEVTLYFNDASGNAQYFCWQQKNSFSF